MGKESYRENPLVLSGREKKEIFMLEWGMLRESGGNLPGFFPPFSLFSCTPQNCNSCSSSRDSVSNGGQHVCKTWRAGNHYVWSGELCPKRMWWTPITVFLSLPSCCSVPDMGTTVGGGQNSIIAKAPSFWSQKGEPWRRKSNREWLKRVELWKTTT